MARIGINPARGKTSTYRPARVTVAVLTCIPHLEGYFQQRLQVLKLCLDSLRQHTSLPYDLMLFDNGSCPQVVDELLRMRDERALDYLILSRQNIGKIGALSVLFNAAPGEVIAYSDDDILFYRGWLEAQLAILERFPRAGMVSGSPVRNAAGHARRSLERLAEEGAPGLVVCRERRIPDAWEADWALSTGRDPQAHLEATRQAQDLVFRLDGLVAIGSADHFQFIAHKQVILEALPGQWTGKLMGHMVELDEAMDANGYLRLSTVERYTRHLGNTISPEVALEAQMVSLSTEGSRLHTKPRRRPLLLRVPGAPRLLRLLYNRLFRLLSGLE